MARAEKASKKVEAAAGKGPGKAPPKQSKAAPAPPGNSDKKGAKAKKGK